jgi:hypothetical protein
MSARGCFDFDRIRFVGRAGKPADEEPKILGLDTETYINGKPFLVCLSNGDVLDPLHAIEQLVEKYSGYHIFCYNLRFDAGSLLHVLPRLPHLNDLREKDKTEWHGIRISVVGDKLLKLVKGSGKGRKAVWLWDAAQFFNTSLEEAAQTLLGKGKGKLSVEEFTKEYVEKHFEEIKQYCIRDAELVAELVEYLVETYHDMTERWPSRFYSIAYWAGEYFADGHNHIAAMRRFWKRNREALRYFTEAYRGGKFEVIKRGYCNKLYVDDINSAYPTAIAELLDLDKARIFYRAGEVPRWADYGAVRCIVVTTFEWHTVGLQEDWGVSFYPIGVFYATITLQEYRYLIRHGVKIVVIDGWYVRCPIKRRIYRAKVLKLFKEKDVAKRRGDKMRYWLCKILLNGFYGKMCQLIPDKQTGVLRAGPLWNPIYASYITAQARIAVSEVQAKWPEHVLAVHTDSVISDKELPLPRGEGLGEWSRDKEGPGIIVMSGIYQVGDRTAQRGIKKLPADLMESIKALDPTDTQMAYIVRRARTWREVAATGGRINCFFSEKRIIDFNKDSKRIWEYMATAGSLFNGLEGSLPRIIFRVPKEYRHLVTDDMLNLPLDKEPEKYYTVVTR